jgi:predicted small metal-binding protein
MTAHCKCGWTSEARRGPLDMDEYVDHLSDAHELTDAVVDDMLEGRT